MSKGLNNYELLKLLGKGAYGRVDLAKDKSTGEQVAIKKIKLSALNIDERKKAMDEVTMMQSLHHPNIVNYHHSFQERTSLYIVMEYIDSGDLEKKIQQRGISHFTENEILFTFVQILLPIAYLHERHILHRDIKPQNVFLMSTGVVKLGDFGVAKSLDSTKDLAKTVIGTPYYLAPEIWDAQPYNTAADIYSLGAILYELCALKKPFEAKSAKELFLAVMRGTYKPIPDFYSEDLKVLVDGMLSQDPALRPTASQIKNMPFIRAAIQALIESNNKKLEAGKQETKALASVKKPAAFGKKRLLGPFLSNKPLMETVKEDDGPAWARKDTKKQVPSFGEERAEEEFANDFIEDEPDTPEEFPDDFIDPDDDEFHLLNDVTTMLQTIDTSENVSAWTYVPCEPRERLVTSNDIPDIALEDDSDNYQVESLRLELQTELGEDVLAELYSNLRKSTPAAKQFVKNFEAKNKRAVQDVRNLIYLEDTI